jgi:hypothetical protein
MICPPVLAHQMMATVAEVTAGSCVLVDEGMLMVAAVTCHLHGLQSCCICL